MDLDHVPAGSFQFGSFAAKGARATATT